MSAGLTARALALRLDGRRLFRPLDLAVAPGEVLLLTGPSGSGKSSLLLALCGLLPARFQLEGDWWLDGQDLRGLPPESRHLGLLFQEALLLPHLTVGENLGFALPRRPGETRQARRARIAATLAEAQLADYGERDPATLSGGQRARVALLRTLLSGPRALLLDEPFAALDPVLRAEIRALVAAQVRRAALPCLLVSHDPAEAAALGAKTIKLLPES